MAAAEFTITIADAKPVRELIEVTQRLIEARAGGADVGQVSAEVDAIEWALARLAGIADATCSKCGERFEIGHWHIDDFQWVNHAG